jgi:hypothetical protein
MFKHLFSGHNDAALYSKICVTLLRDFGVDLKIVERAVGQSLMVVCGAFRQSELNPESVAIIILSKILVIMKDNPALFVLIPVRDQAWVDQALNYGRCRLVVSSELKHFLYDLAYVSSPSTESALDKAFRWFEDAALKGNSSGHTCHQCHKTLPQSGRARR